MGKIRDTLHLSKRAAIPEHAVRTAPENTARALTPAEAQARRIMLAIAKAEATAKAELAARAKDVETQI